MSERQTIAWDELRTCRRCQGKLVSEEQSAHPGTHCVCPSGDVWQQLEGRPIGVQMRLHQARQAWETAKRPRMVYYFRDGVRCEMDLHSWRKFLTGHWDELLAFDPDVAMAS